MFVASPRQSSRLSAASSAPATPASVATPLLGRRSSLALSESTPRVSSPPPSDAPSPNIPSPPSMSPSTLREVAAESTPARRPEQKKKKVPERPRGGPVRRVEIPRVEHDADLPFAPPAAARASRVSKARAATMKRAPGPRAVTMPKAMTKKLFTRFATVKVSRDAIPAVLEGVEKYFDQLAADLDSYARHAKRKTIEKIDMECLFKRQRLTNDKLSFDDLVRTNMATEYVEDIIPIARADNKLEPKKPV